MVRRPADPDMNGFNGSTRNGLLKIALWYGPGVLITAWIVYWLATSITADLKSRQTEHQHIVDVLVEQNRQIDAIVQRFTFALYVVCINTSDTPYQVSVCNQQEPAIPRYQQPYDPNRPQDAPKPPPKPKPETPGFSKDDQLSGVKK